MPGSDDSSPKKREASLLGAVTVVVGSMIGTGVFTALGFQVGGLPSGFAILALWIVGGLVAFCGAVCYAELAAMFPQSGGEYHLLGSALHPLPGFLAGWVSVFAGFAAPVALASSAFGSYFASSGIGVNATALGIMLIVVVTLVHLISIVVSSRFQSSVTIGKIVLLIVIILAALGVDEPQPVQFLPDGIGDWNLITSGGFATALLWVHYSYEGWNGAAYIAGEVRNAQRNVPLALLLGTGLVTLLYTGLNAAFLHAAPMTELEGQKEVGLVAAKYIFGESGGQIMGLLISAGLISAVSAMMWVGPRVSARMGDDYRLLQPLAMRNKQGVPIVATIVQALLAILFLCVAKFEAILTYAEVLLLLSSTTTVATVIWLRITRPEMSRPYRAFAYPLTPLLFIAVASYTLYWAYDRHVEESRIGSGILLAGIVFYAICRRHQRATA